MLKENNNYDYMDQRLPDDGGRSLEDIISAVGEQELAEVPHVPMTPERLAALAAAHDADENPATAKTNHNATEVPAASEPNRGVTDENLAAPTPAAEAANKTKKRKRLYKLVGGIAAVFVLILIGAVVAFNALSVDVGADKNQKEEIVTEDGVVIEDGGYGASDNTEGNVWVAKEWKEIPTTKKLYPQLMIPEYIPEGYDFEQLTVEQIETGDLTCEYIFSNTEGDTLEIEMFIMEGVELSTEVNDFTDVLNCSKGTIYIQEDDKKMATIQMDGGVTIQIWNDCSNEILIKIIDGLAI